MLAQRLDGCVPSRWDRDLSRLFDLLARATPYHGTMELTPQPERKEHVAGTIRSDRGRRTTELGAAELLAELAVALQDGPPLVENPHLARELGAFLVEVESQADVCFNRYSRVKQRLLFEQFRRHPSFQPSVLRGGCFVELGCGVLNPLAGLLVLKAAGAGRCIGIDLDVVPNEHVAVRALAKVATEMIAEPSWYLDDFPVSGEQVRANLERFDIAALDRGEVAGLEGTELEFRQVSADATGIEADCVDGIASASFLEHVPDLDAVLAEMARVSKSGAGGSHRIDGVDHRSYRDSGVGEFDFLSIESNEPLLYCCNRIRPSEFAARFEAAGFDVVRCDPLRRLEVTEEMRDSMVEPYRSMTIDDLGLVGVEIMVQRR